MLLFDGVFIPGTGLSVMVNKLRKGPDLPAPGEGAALEGVALRMDRVAFFPE
jgi:hypothetical protein